MKRLHILVLLVVCFVMSSCPGRLGSDTTQALAIMRMPENERQREFNKLTPRRQVDVYLAGVTKVEPPLMLQAYLASNWKAVLPIVKERLVSDLMEGLLG